MRTASEWLGTVMTLAVLLSTPKGREMLEWKSASTGGDAEAYLYLF